MGEDIRRFIEEDAERRKYARVATNLYISYTIDGSETHEAGVFLTKNVSGGGILFESFREIPIGTVFDLSINLPTHVYPIVARGKVTRVQKVRDYGRYDVGLELLNIGELDRRELIKYLVSTVFTKEDCETLFKEKQKEAVLSPS